ncbi:AmmeMemoradiSam system radical SAM enzyme [Kipferlia bialata]|uniref:AmmeMemoradiSam system radical SAM enzyme n=1 Tax=Kipferlia bialata TaxID=797122 RepID=A0A9K3D113_9EUKA|nr:AmmeMemoradiSam system radical SAM enzyme [Kipferlia bialata]|eukprot:g8091.t1
MGDTRETPDECILYEKKPHGVVRCQCCCFYCTIQPGGVGHCGVRVNEQGKLKLLVYGRPSAVHVDPIEKKPLYHFFPGTECLSLGVVGCNYSCSFCQNYSLSMSMRDKQEAGADIEELAGHVKHQSRTMSPADIARYCEDANLGVAFTYNEPSIACEYWVDTIEALKERDGQHYVVYVSNGGFTAEQAELLSRTVDPRYFGLNIDVKGDQAFYKKLCKAPLQPVLDSVRRCHELGFHVEVTTLVIPGENDSEECLSMIAREVAAVSPNIVWHLSAFHPDYQMQDHKRTSLAILERARAIGEREGLRYIYLGNVHNDGSTRCAKCKAVVVERRGYGARVTQKLVVDGRKGTCVCGEPIPGVFGFE